MTNAESEELRGLLRDQGGVVTRAQALEGGLSRHAVSYRVRPGGPWQVILPGVYLTVTGTATERQREIAAILYGGSGSAITGLTAVHRYRIPAPEPSKIDLLIPASRHCQSVSYVLVHRTARVPKQVMGSPVISYTLPARAVADAALWLGDRREVRAMVAGAVQTGLCSVGQITEELRAGPMRDSGLLRAVLGEATAGVRSAPEAELRVLIKKAGLPEPMFNPRLYAPDGTFIASPDAWWPEAGVAVEVDSRRWHLRPDDWERTMERHDRLGQYGVVTLHFSPHKLRSEEASVITTLRNAYKSGASRPRLPITALAAVG